MLLWVSAYAQSGDSIQTGKEKTEYSIPKGKGKMRQRREIADSIRLAMRHAADEGRLLQWGDSLLQTRLDSGQINAKQYKRFSHRLRRYDRFLHRGDSLLAGHYGKINFDTLYILRPPGRWTIKFRGNVAGSTIETEGMKDGSRFNARVESDARATLSAAVTYRGISLGLAINPAKLAGRNKDNELNLTSYGNKFGFDVTYLTSKTYQGNVLYDDVETPVSKGMVSQKALNVNLYYAFNGRRFSIPAAFSQNYIQRRSAGSFMVGMSFDGQSTDIDAVPEAGFGKVKLRIVELGLGAGYGYNLVAGRHWLIHFSALPTFNVFAKTHITDGDERVNMHYKFPSIIVTGRGAALYSWHNKFIGASIVFNHSGIGDRDRLYVKRNRWRVRMFYGFRF